VLVVAAGMDEDGVSILGGFYGILDGRVVPPAAVINIQGFSTGSSSLKETDHCQEDEGSNDQFEFCPRHCQFTALSCSFPG